MTPEERGKRAEELFLSGYNCPQSVALAFADLSGMDADELAKTVSGFGGGICRMREMCGAVSGMMFILGRLEGYSSPEDDAGKTALYTTGQQLIRSSQQLMGMTVISALISSASPAVRNLRSLRQEPKGIIKTVHALRLCGQPQKFYRRIWANDVNMKHFLPESCPKGRISQIHKKPLTRLAENAIILLPLVPGNKDREVPDALRMASL